MMSFCKIFFVYFIGIEKKSILRWDDKFFFSFKIIFEVGLIEMLVKIIKNIIW